MPCKRSTALPLGRRHFRSRSGYGSVYPHRANLGSAAVSAHRTKVPHRVPRSRVTPGLNLSLDVEFVTSGMSSSPQVGVAYLGAVGQVLSSVNVAALARQTTGLTEVSKLILCPPELLSCASRYRASARLTSKRQER